MDDKLGGAAVQVGHVRSYKPSFACVPPCYLSPLKEWNKIGESVVLCPFSFQSVIQLSSSVCLYMLSLVQSCNICVFHVFTKHYLVHIPFLFCLVFLPF